MNDHDDIARAVHGSAQDGEAAQTPGGEAESLRDALANGLVRERDREPVPELQSRALPEQFPCQAREERGAANDSGEEEGGGSQEQDGMDDAGLAGGQELPGGSGSDLDDGEIGYIVIQPEGEGGEAGFPEGGLQIAGGPLENALASEHGVILEKLAALSRQMESLGQDFESKLKYDEHKQKTIDSLHKELQEHKDGLVKKHVQSMIMDIIKVIDDVRKIVRFYREKELADSDLPKLIDILEGLPSDMEDIFSFQGVRPFSCDGPDFDPARQRVLQKIDTDDPSLDKTVAKSLLPGYEWGGRILRPENIAVYTYKPVSGQQEN